MTLEDKSKSVKMNVQKGISGCWEIKEEKDEKNRMIVAGKWCIQGVPDNRDQETKQIY